MANSVCPQGKGKSPPGVYPGDRLFKVNGDSTELMSLEAAWSSVARATRPVMLHFLGPVSSALGNFAGLLWMVCTSVAGRKRPQGHRIDGSIFGIASTPVAVLAYYECNLMPPPGASILILSVFTSCTYAPPSLPTAVCMRGKKLTSFPSSHPDCSNLPPPCLVGCSSLCELDW